MLRYTTIETPLGQMAGVASGGGVCALVFLDGRDAHDTGRSVADARAVEIGSGASPHLDQLADELAEYFAGRRRGFTVALDLAGTPFQRRVWSRLLEIPFGETACYERIALDLGDAGATRAVGVANGANPVAVVVPCHRVVNKSGALGGYAGGLDRKRFLLDLEGAGAQAPLFA